MALKIKELPGKEIQNHGILPDKVLHFHSELFVKKSFYFIKSILLQKILYQNKFFQNFLCVLGIPFCRFSPSGFAIS